jgi:hypothetical protein
MKYNDDARVFFVVSSYTGRHWLTSVSYANSTCEIPKCTAHVELVLAIWGVVSSVLKISPALPIMLQSVVTSSSSASGIGYALLSSPPHTLSLKKSMFHEILFHHCVFCIFFLFVPKTGSSTAVVIVAKATLFWETVRTTAGVCLVSSEEQNKVWSIFKRNLMCR